MKQLTALLLTLCLLPLAAAAEGSAPVTRGEMLIALWETSGGFPYEANTYFVDVDHDAEYSASAAWAYDEGLVLGVGARRLSPDRPVTREEAAVLLRRYAAWKDWDVSSSSHLAACNDYEDCSPWAGDALWWAIENRLLDWSASGRLDPSEPVSSAELAAACGLF